MTLFIVRPYIADDSSRIVANDETNSFVEQLMHVRGQRRPITLVADYQGLIVGCAAGFVFESSNSPGAMLDVFGVARNARGLGVGRALYEEFFFQAKRRGALYVLRNVPEAYSSSPNLRCLKRSVEGCRM